ncbi:MAG: glycosyltransferase family 39 protein [Deltaproteobacteria bacterium]|nr:glycosyltransferase family 39 protein [Deltaproteobacteria bacterium]
MRKAVVYLLVIVAFGGVLFFYNLGGWDLWNPDEPRYAQVAKEMLSGQGWLVPHLNSAVYFEKPPFFFWSIAAAAKLLGAMNESAARLPSAIFAVLTLILTFFMGKRLFNEKVGLFAALILATNVEFFWLGRRGGIDVTLTFFTTAAIFLFYVGFYLQRGRWAFYSLAYCAMALGVLIKAQVAVIVPLLVVGGYFLIQREFTFFKDRSHLPGLVLFLTVIGGWIVLTSLSGGKDYVTGLLYHRTTLRFFQGPSHQRPIYYYLARFPGDFLPWTIFLPSALIYGLSAKGRKREFLPPFFWFLVIFVSFSLSKGKREIYLLPLYPAVALMVGYLWNELSLSAEGAEKKLLTVPLFTMIIISVLAAIGLPIMVALKGPRYLEHPWEIGVVLGFILGAGALLCSLAQRYRRLDLPFYLIVAMMFALGLYSTARIFPEINPYKSARPISQAIVSIMRPGDQLGVYRLQGSEYNYYTGLEKITRAETEEQLNDFLRSPQRIFCIMRKRHYERLKGGSTLQFYMVLKRQVGHRCLVVISNRNTDKKM